MLYEIVKVGVGVIDVASGVVGNALRSKQFAVSVVNGHHFVDDFDSTAILIDNGFGWFRGGGAFAWILATYGTGTFTW